MLIYKSSIMRGEGASDEKTLILPRPHRLSGLGSLGSHTSRVLFDAFHEGDVGCPVGPDEPLIVSFTEVVSKDDG